MNCQRADLLALIARPYHFEFCGGHSILGKRFLKHGWHGCVVSEKPAGQQANDGI
jgi:hypothetical protein